jgi:hypothetical protein
MINTTEAVRLFDLWQELEDDSLGFGVDTFSVCRICRCSLVKIDGRWVAGRFEGILPKADVLSMINLERSHSDWLGR